MELNIRAATGGRTLTVFGDSVAKGLYLETNTIKHIERPAAATFAAQAGMRLDNRSAFGLTLEKCRRKGYFEEYLKRPLEAGDAAAIALGGNDCDYDWKRVAEDPFGYHLPHTPLPLFEEMLDDTITLFLKNGVTPALVALPPIISERFFSKNDLCARGQRRRAEIFRGGRFRYIPTSGSVQWRRGQSRAFARLSPDRHPYRVPDAHRSE